MTLQVRHRRVHVRHGERQMPHLRPLLQHPPLVVDERECPRFEGLRGAARQIADLPEPLARHLELALALRPLPVCLPADTFRGHSARGDQPGVRVSKVPVRNEDELESVLFAADQGAQLTEEVVHHRRFAFGGGATQLGQAFLTDEIRNRTPIAPAATSGPAVFREQLASDLPRRQVRGWG